MVEYGKTIEMKRTLLLFAVIVTACAAYGQDSLNVEIRHKPTTIQVSRWTPYIQTIKKLYALKDSIIRVQDHYLGMINNENDSLQEIQTEMNKVNEIISNLAEEESTEYPPTIDSLLSLSDSLQIVHDAIGARILEQAALVEDLNGPIRTIEDSISSKGQEFYDALGLALKGTSTEPAPGSRVKMFFTKPVEGVTTVTFTFKKPE